MTVGFTARVDIRPYSGFTDPSLPVASWISQLGVVGDASGGFIFIDFAFQRDNDPRSSELFNLEQFSVDINSATNRFGLLETIRMDNLAPNRPASPQKWQIDIEGVTAVAVAANSLRSGSLLPLWLGAPNQDEGQSGLRFSAVNVDLLLYAVTLQGYMWGPRSVLAPGGPQRPLGGMFG